MSTFNATDAIFFGFRVVKRDPLLVLALTALLGVTSLAGMQLVWPEIVELAAAAQALSVTSPDADPEEVFASMRALYGGFLGSPAVLGFFAAQLLASLVIQGAILRSLVRDRREGWVLGMQLGGDELRIFVVGLVVLILVLLAYCAALAAVFVLAGLLAASSALAGVVVVLGLGAVTLATALVGVRLSAAAPASVGERKFIVFGSWRLTAGRMWGLLGAYVVLFFVAMVVTLIVIVPTSLIAPQATALLQGMTPLGALEDPGAAFRSPGYVLVTLLNALVNVVVIAAWSGVGAYAYRMLGGGVGYPNAHPPEDAATAPA